MVTDQHSCHRVTTNHRCGWVFDDSSAPVNWKCSGVLGGRWTRRTRKGCRSDRLSSARWSLPSDFENHAPFLNQDPQAREKNRHELMPFSRRGILDFSYIYISCTWTVESTVYIYGRDTQAQFLLASTSASMNLHLQNQIQCSLRRACLEWGEHLLHVDLGTVWCMTTSVRIQALESLHRVHKQALDEDCT